MNLKTLDCFLAVMEEGSFSKAAERIYTTQSNISKQMKKLEDDLGITLLDRTASGVLPTPAANYLYSGLKETLPELLHLLEQTRRYPQPGNEQLVVLVSDSMSVNHLMPLLNRFQEKCPSVRMEIECLPKEIIRTRLMAGKADVAFIFNPETPEFAGLSHAVVTRSNPLIYFAKRMFPDRQPERIEDFRGCTFVCLRHPYDGAFDYLSALPFTPAKIRTLDSLRTLQTQVSAGLACAILGSSQLLRDNTSISTFELPDCTEKAGTDAIWREDNDNPALFYFLKSL